MTARRIYPAGQGIEGEDEQRKVTKSGSEVKASSNESRGVALADQDIRGNLGCGINAVSSVG